MSQAIFDPHAFTNLNDSIILSIMQSTKEELAEVRKKDDCSYQLTMLH